MTLLTPLALLAGLVVPAIILLYMLKKRTRPQTVSSIMLWQRLERINIPALRLSKLLRNLLLLLQVLTAIILVLALARPVLNVLGQRGRTGIIIIDTSMSMAVAESGETRLEQALNQAGNLVKAKAPGDRFALITMGEAAAVVSGFNSDGSALLRALAQIEIASARANPDAALALAENMARAEEGAEIILFSSGSYATLARTPQAPFTFITLGEAQVANLLVEDVVPDGDRLYVSIYNNGTEALPAQVEVRDNQGGLIGRREVELESGRRQVLVWRSLPQAPWYKVTIVSAEDQVALDNSFFALAAAPAPSRLLLVSQGNLFLERALLLYPDLSVSRVAPEAYRPGMAELYDIFVLDGFLPEALPPAPVLVFDPPHPNAHFGTGPPLEISSLRPLPHPLLTHVDFSEVSVGYGKTLVGGSGFLESQAGLLASEYRQKGQSMVVFGFAVQAGDLPLRPAFPILLRNILDYFGGGRQQDSPLKYGQWVPGGDTALYYLDSTDQLRPGTRLGAGIYKMESGGEAQTLTVNVPISTDSFAARHELETETGTVAGEAKAAGGLPLLWPLLLSALVLVGLEWWVDNYGS